MSDLKATLNDKVISRLPLADKRRYVVRDTDLRGFFVVLGARRKTFTVQGEFRRRSGLLPSCSKGSACRRLGCWASPSDPHAIVRQSAIELA